MKFMIRNHSILIRIACFVALFSLLTGCKESNEEVINYSSRIMDPTIKEGAVIRVNRNEITADAIRRFDVVTVRIPTLEVETVLRVIGLPGETVHITESGLLIDDEMIDLPQSVVYSGSFEMPTYFGTESPVSIPGERFFVIGDNMPIARDSRVFGFISIERITGVVVGY